MKTISELADEHSEAHAQLGLLLTPDETVAQAVAALRFYAAFGNVRSLTGTDNTPEAGDLEPDELVAPGESYPVKDLENLNGQTVVSTGEWAIIRPLFLLYIERQNAVRLEASRASGVEPYGRSSSEVQADINQMETDLPQRAFSHVLTTI